MKIVEWLAFNKVATISSSLFYLFVLFIVFSPKIRKYSGELFSQPSPSIRIHNAALDSLRGIAAAAVVMAHIWNFCRPIFDTIQAQYLRCLCTVGNKAVVVFVILSGFLIYRSCKRLDSIDDLKFYLKRRFYRIYPVYLFTVLLGVVVGQMSFHWPNFLSNVFMIRTIHHNALTYVNPPAWSLYVEVLFYLVLPLWVILFKNQERVAAAICFIIFLFVDPLGGRELWLWKFFFIGILTSELSDYLKTRISEKFAIVLFMCGIILLFIDLSINKQGEILYDWFNELHIVPRNADHFTMGLAISTIFIMIGILHSKSVSRLLGIKPLKFLGSISYSLFLTHTYFILAVFPKLQFPKVGTVQNLIDPVVYAPAWYLPFVMFPGSLVFAMICFVTVERPFLLLSRKSALDKSLQAA